MVSTCCASPQLREQYWLILLPASLGLYYTRELECSLITPRVEIITIISPISCSCSARPFPNIFVNDWLYLLQFLSKHCHPLHCTSQTEKINCIALQQCGRKEPLRSGKMCAGRWTKCCLNESDRFLWTEHPLETISVWLVTHSGQLDSLFGHFLYVKMPK